MAELQREESKRTFDAKAKDFDSNPTLIELCGAASKALRGAGLLRPDAVAMDFGCGTGLLSLAITGDVTLVVGVDSSEGMVRHFQGKIASDPGCKARAVCCELEHPGSLHTANDPADPFPERFDLVCSTMTTHHIQDIPSLLRLLSSHLKPGGAIAVFDYQVNDHSHLFHPQEMNHTVFHPAGFTTQQFCELFQGAGLEEVSCRVVHNFKKAAGDDPTGEPLDFELLMAVGRRKKEE